MGKNDLWIAAVAHILGAKHPIQFSVPGLQSAPCHVHTWGKGLVRADKNCFFRYFGPEAPGGAPGSELGFAKFRRSVARQGASGDRAFYPGIKRGAFFHNLRSMKLENKNYEKTKITFHFIFCDSFDLLPR